MVVNAALCACPWTMFELTALPKIHVDRLEALRTTVLPLFEKACRITEAHSQPLETLGSRPTLADFETDWRTAQEALRIYKD